MNEFVRQLLRAIFFLAVQALLLDRVPPLHRVLTPSLYLLFLLWMPFRIGKAQLVAVGFFYGLTVSYTHLTLPTKA